MCMGVRRGRCFLLAAILVAVTGCASSGAATPGSARTTTLGTPTLRAMRADGPPLVGTEWQLISYRDPAKAGPIAVNTDSTLEFNGKGVFFAHACNFINGEATITSRTIMFTAGGSTAMACTGEPNMLEREVEATANGSVSWSISGRILTLKNSNGRLLGYRVRPSIYPDLNAHTIIAGQRAGGQFRLAVQGHGRALSLVFEERSAAIEPWGTAGLAAPEPKDCLADFVISAGSLGRKAFLVAWATSNVAKVATRATTNSPQTNLAFYKVPGSTLRIAGLWTSAFRPSISPVTFYDRHGTIIAQYPNGPC